MGINTNEDASSFGRRVALLRADKGYSLAGLGSMLPDKRGKSWMQAVEDDKQIIPLHQAIGLAEALGTTLQQLAYGEVKESELVGRIRYLDEHKMLDGTAVRVLLATADAQAEETKKRAAEVAQTEDEATMLLRFRSMSEAERRAWLTQTLPRTASDQDEQTPDQEEEDRRRQAE